MQSRNLWNSGSQFLQCAWYNSFLSPSHHLFLLSLLPIVCLQIKYNILCLMTWMCMGKLSYWLCEMLMILFSWYNFVPARGLLQVFIFHIILSCIEKIKYFFFSWDDKKKLHKKGLVWPIPSLPCGMSSRRWDSSWRSKFNSINIHEWCADVIVFFSIPEGHWRGELRRSWNFFLSIGYNSNFYCGHLFCKMTENVLLFRCNNNKASCKCTSIIDKDVAQNVQKICITTFQ